MRNIIRIFTSDAKRLATNVVAVVMIIGLTVIPSLTSCPTGIHTERHLQPI